MQRLALHRPRQRLALHRPRGVQRLEDCALERSLNGTPTPIVSGGAILGTWDKPDNTLLRFLLQHRLPQKYAAQKPDPAPGGPRAPGHRMTRAEAIAADKKEDEIFAEIDRKLEIMRRRELTEKWRDRGPARAARRAALLDEMAAPLADTQTGPVFCMPAGKVE